MDRLDCAHPSDRSEPRGHAYTLIQLTHASGFRGRVAVASHDPGDTEDLIGAGADIVLDPFQDAADRAVELLCGAPEEDRTEFPLIETEEKQTP